LRDARSLLELAAPSDGVAAVPAAQCASMPAGDERGGRRHVSPPTEAGGTAMQLPQGVSLSPLAMNQDERGWLTEIFRDEWADGETPCQWNANFSHPNVLRGVHGHYRHWDYVVALRGRISVGLYDARRKAPSYGVSALIEIGGERLVALSIPPGVLHGFYFHESTQYINGVSAYYDVGDELACRWTDPGLRIDWPCRNPVIGERDRKAGSLAEIEARLRALNPDFG
jgi:dTDP-4-dehydrorhamnose 3,5-epimerase